MATRAQEIEARADLVVAVMAAQGYPEIGRLAAEDLCLLARVEQTLGQTRALVCASNAPNRWRASAEWWMDTEDGRVLASEYGEGETAVGALLALAGKLEPA